MKFYLLLVFFNSQFLFLNFLLFDHYANAVFNPSTKPIISFCAGGNHMCAVFNDQRMKCMGKADNIGALMNYGNSPSTIGDNVPYFNPGTSLLITKVTCLLEGLCVLLNTGNIKCVGDNIDGQMGMGVATPIIGASSGHIGDTLPVVELGAGVVVASLVGGYHHVCVLTIEKKVKCFGKGSWGQLGYRDTNNRGKLASDMGNSLPYVDFGVGIEVASIHSGPTSNHNCVILYAPPTAAQRIKCWGFNGDYQLGYGDSYNRGGNIEEMGDSLPLVDLGIESRVKQVVLGLGYTCAFLFTNQLKCFGMGLFGQLGSGSSAHVTATGNLIPSVTIDTGKAIFTIAAVDYTTCIVYDDMIAMKCIGANGEGQLGQGDINDRGANPTTMIPSVPAINLGTGALQITSIHSGAAFNCVIFADYSVKCFGYNQYGNLGIGATDSRGDESIEMSNNLHFVEFFSPTQSPTRNPTVPTLSPTIRPTMPPTMIPTTQSPTNAPATLSISPTRSPTAKSNSPNTPTFPTSSATNCRTTTLSIIFILLLFMLVMS